jgi:uncharacterized protein YjiS (DUF1127 family)
MAALTSARPIGHASTSGKPGLLGAVLTAFENWRQRRATRNALEQLSDHQLDDIGLTRDIVIRL